MGGETNFVDLRFGDLRKVPVGSLILVAHHDPKERARLLRLLAFGAVNEELQVLWLCLSERTAIAASGLDESVWPLFRDWASEGARKAVPDPDYPKTGTQEERSAIYSTESKKAETKRKSRETSIYENYAASWLRWRNEDQLVRFAELDGRLIDSLDEEVRDNAGQILLVDDISALRRDQKKSPSNKQCGEHARYLKELALDCDLVVVAGMPAPIVNAKEQYTNKVHETSIELEDLVGYGAPNEAADIVYTMHPGRFEPRPCSPRLLQHRYA